MPDRSRPGKTSLTTALPTALPQGGGDKFTTGTRSRSTPSLSIPRNETIIGTWNVRTLYACGKVKELTHELDRYRWDILGLAEVRWTSCGETTTEEGHKIWYSGEDSRHQHGVGFIVNKNKINSVINCTPISSRLISIRIAARPMNITIIQVYAPTSDYDDEAVETFYEELENTIKKTPKKDFLVIQGDWNAKIGTDAFDHWGGTAGQFGLGETNDRGLRLLDFARSHKLTVANTLFPHKISRRTTWHAPNGETHNQIDYILTPQRFKSSINKARTRTFPGADIGSDHDMVLLTLKLKLKTQKKHCNTRIRFSLDKLKDPHVAEIFEANIGGKFATLNLLQDIDLLTDKMEEVMTETATKVLGKDRKKNKPWITDDILDQCDLRRALKKTKEDPEAAKQHTSVNRNIRKMMRKAKEKWITDQCASIDTGLRQGNSKAAYTTLKKLTRTQQRTATIIEDKHGLPLTEKAEITQRWTEYCQELYNFTITPDPTILANTIKPCCEYEDAPILQAEVEEAVKTLKIGKSPGIDNIPAELWTHGGQSTIIALTHICQQIWETKQWPQKWTQSLIIPIPKKGNSRQCQNYRTISLICHASKVMLRIILNRLRNRAEEILSEEQAGFRPRRSTTEQIFNVRLLIEKHLQHQHNLYHNFIDFKKAFDRVWHEGLWQALRHYNFNNNLIQVIQALYTDSCSAVLINNSIGESFRTSIGVRQGCLLSPVLFNVFLDNIMEKALHEFHTSITIGGRPISNLRFADDIDLMGKSEDELQELTTRLEEAARAYGMEISAEKSKILVNSHNHLPPPIITMNGQILEDVKDFKYLGSFVSADGSSTKEIKTRIGIATSAMTRLATIWKSNTISFRVKVRLYKSLVLSTLLYGCESWTLTADTERRIQSFENKCYRRMLHISYREHRTNDYVSQLVTTHAGEQEPLLSTVKRRKLTWYGHITRHTSLSKTILQGTIEGKRRRGRQRKAWMDNIKEWTGCSFQTLLRTAEDRERWRSLTAQATTMTPLRPPRPWDD